MFADRLVGGLFREESRKANVKSFTFVGSHGDAFMHKRSVA